MRGLIGEVKNFATKRPERGLGSYSTRFRKDFPFNLGGVRLRRQVTGCL